MQTGNLSSPVQICRSLFSPRPKTEFTPVDLCAKNIYSFRLYYLDSGKRFWTCENLKYFGRHLDIALDYTWHEIDRDKSRKHNDSMRKKYFTFDLTGRDLLKLTRVFSI